MSKETKICCRCRECKPLSEFHKHKGRQGGVRSACKSCLNQAARDAYKQSPNIRERIIHATCASYSKHRPKRLSYSRQYRETHKAALAFAQICAKENNPSQFMAHNMIHQAIKKHQLPHPSSLKCCWPGCKNQAALYHHANGYDEDHWLDVEPLCRRHHGEAHRFHADTSRLN